MSLNQRTVLVTGSKGFIGKNLVVKLKENSSNVLEYTRSESLEELKKFINESEVIFHLAGENRPKKPESFFTINVKLTEHICNFVQQKFIQTGKHTPIVMASSIHAAGNTEYGASKRRAEELLLKLSDQTGNPVNNYRLPGIFGKWANPNYNSVVATFCYNLVNGKSLNIVEPRKALTLAYVDDVLDCFIEDLENQVAGFSHGVVRPEYKISVEELAAILLSFKNSRKTLFPGKVGLSIERALYSTYLSYLSPDMFRYQLTIYKDARGDFGEFLKTTDQGQISYISVKPSQTRGCHYHHTKTEKFLVLNSKAKFCFRHIVTGETSEVVINGGSGSVIETIPGWHHDITNLGDTDMYVILWANEIFDPLKPDTFRVEQ